MTQKQSAVHSVFHSGERSVQDRAGVSLRTREMAARAIRNAMPEQHKAFFEALPLAFLALLDIKGRPWALPVSGSPGFMTALSPRQLVLRQVPPLLEDFALDTSIGAKIGLVGLDFSTRRRNRLNGRIVLCDKELEIAVDQSFGNCPKYIKIRDIQASLAADRSPQRRQVQIDNPKTRRILSSADTLFIASRTSNAIRGKNDALDVSHRGGRVGFLRVNENGTLSLPDFSGNQYFNTLGNIASDGRVGLFVPDFNSGDAILLTGRATIDWSYTRIANFNGAERMIDIVPDEVWKVRNVTPCTEDQGEAWPGLVHTGTWQHTDLRR